MKLKMKQIQTMISSVLSASYFVYVNTNDLDFVSYEKAVKKELDRVISDSKKRRCNNEV